MQELLLELLFNFFHEMHNLRTLGHALLIDRNLTSPLHVLWRYLSSVSARSNDSSLTFNSSFISHAHRWISWKLIVPRNDYHFDAVIAYEGNRNSMVCLELKIVPSLSIETVLKWAESECLYFLCSDPHYVCIFWSIMYETQKFMGIVLNFIPLGYDRDF